MRGCTSTEEVVRQERPRVENRKWCCQAFWAISAVLSGSVCIMMTEMKLRTKVFSFTGRKGVESRWQLLSRCKMSKMEGRGAVWSNMFDSLPLFCPRHHTNEVQSKPHVNVPPSTSSPRCILKDFYDSIDGYSLQSKVRVAEVTLACVNVALFGLILFVNHLFVHV